jgi:hypothetical protein
MADEDARRDAAAPPPPADAHDAGAGGIAEWIKRVRTFNRERDAGPLGENANDAPPAGGEPVQPAARPLSLSGSTGA